MLLHAEKDAEMEAEGDINYVTEIAAQLEELLSCKLDHLSIHFGDSSKLEEFKQVRIEARI